MPLVSRASAMLGIASTLLSVPTAVLAETRQEQKKRFIAQCDESISIERLAGAPYKFKGKKVDLHGLVGPPMEDARAFNLNSANDVSEFVVVIGDARTLERGQSVRVLGTVFAAITGQTTTGGGGTFAVVRAEFIE